ncbi:hypothetical protein [Neobacillus niacini]|uniref:hypothetical protein n=1 Tax=Neobacillus niacini TaxID=86668 RepID=UPI001EE76DF5|nr:hypothetical protein [Neobacillus niacini]
MFELLSGGIVEYICNKIWARGIEYGFGGIAKPGQGILPAEKILTEHYRLGSQMLILSRSFINLKEFNDPAEIQKIINDGVSEIRDFEEKILKYDNEKLEINRQNLVNIVNNICNKIPLKSR